MRYDDYQDQNTQRDGLKRFKRWISTRPMECWGFFAAGFLIARIIF